MQEEIVEVDEEDVIQSNENSPEFDMVNSKEANEAKNHYHDQNDKPSPKKNLRLEISGKWKLS